nr:MAG TPA: homing endonuclease [Crassvirales sp.]
MIKRCCINENIQLTDESYKDNPVLLYNKQKYFIIPNFEKYAISKEGKILNTHKGIITKTYTGIDNYEHCILFIRGKRYRKRVHRLMGKMFLGNPQVVNHKDGDKSNNILSNLERSTHALNIKHAYDNNVYNSKYKVIVRCINKYTKEKIMCRSMREAQRVTGIDRHRIKTFLNNSRPNYTNWEFII